MIELQQVLYTAQAHSVGGRTGRVHTDDGRLDLELAPPRKRTPATNPEQLFAAGFAACFLSSLAEVADADGIKVTDAQVNCRVKLGTTDTPAGYGLAAEIVVYLPGIDITSAEDLAEKAEETCPYSQAVRGNIPMRVTISDIPLDA